MSEPKDADDRLSEERCEEILNFVVKLTRGEALYTMGAVAGQLQKLRVLSQQDTDAIENIVGVAYDRIAN